MSGKGQSGGEATSVLPSGVHFRVKKESSSREDQIKAIFRKYFADLLRLLKICSDLLPATLYSKELLNSDYMDMSKLQILRSLQTVVESEPDKVFEIIDCFDEEGLLNNKLKAMRDELEDTTSLPKRHCQVPVGVSTISRYKEFLQSQYKKRTVAFDDKLNIAPCHEFIKLIVIDKNRVPSTMAPSITLENVISSEDKFVVVEAAPGMGKSTLSLELCRCWDVFDNLQRFKIILLLRLREPRVHKISSLKDVFFHDDESLSDCVVQEVLKKEGSDVLFIFDGYDELPASYFEESTECLLSRLVSGECLPHAVRLITTRASVLYKLKIQLQFYKHVEITGFDNESKIQFARVAFQSKPDYLVGQFENLVTSNAYINSLMDIPVNCAIIVTLFEDLLRGRRPPNTMTELFSLVTVSVIRRHKIGSREWSVEDEVPEFDQLADKVGASFNDVCQLAYNSLFNQSGFFQIHKNKCFNHLGLMVETKEMYVAEGVQTTLSFFHRTFHAFLAACFAAKSQEFDYNELFQRTQQYDEPFLLFYCGLSKPSNLCSLFYDESLIPQQTILKCAYESQYPEIINSVSNRMVRLESNLDLYILGYFLVHFNFIWKIYTNSRTIDSFAPLATSIQYHEKLNHHLQGGISHITDDFGSTIKDISLLPESLLLKISSLDVRKSHFELDYNIKHVENCIKYLTRNLVKIKLTIGREKYREVSQLLQSLKSLKHLREINLTIFSLYRGSLSSLINVLKKKTLRHIYIGACLDNIFYSTRSSIIHALFTSTSVESVNISFHVGKKSQFLGTKVKVSHYGPLNVCEVIPYIHYGLKINPQVKFKIYCTNDTNCFSISSLAKVYRLSEAIISEKMQSQARLYTDDTGYIFPPKLHCDYDQYSLGPDLQLNECRVRGRRRSCPELLYIRTVSSIPTNGRVQITF